MTERLNPQQAARMHRALTAAGSELQDLVEEADEELLHGALKNPHLNETHLLAILKRRNLSQDLVAKMLRLALLCSGRRLKVALAAHPSLTSAQLAQLLQGLHLFELVEVLRSPGGTEDQKVAVERALLQRLPATELGNRIALARRGTPRILDALLQQGELRQVEAVLQNPDLKEASVYAFLNSPAAGAETISAVARHPRWGARPNLRLTLLKNRKTPTVWFTLFAPSLSTSELHQLVSGQGLTPLQREELRLELEKRER